MCSSSFSSSRVLFFSSLLAHFLAFSCCDWLARWQANEAQHEDERKLLKLKQAKHEYRMQLEDQVCVCF